VVALGVAVIADPNGQIDLGVGAGSRAIAGPVTAVRGRDFSIEMPGRPVREATILRTPGGIERAAFYRSETASGSFELEVVKLPYPLPSGPPGRDRVRKLAAAIDREAALGGRATTYAGRPAIDMALRADVTEFSRVIRAPGERFRLSVFLLDRPSSPPAAYTAFLASLKLSGAQP